MLGDGLADVVVKRFSVAIRRFLPRGKNRHLLTDARARSCCARLNCREYLAQGSSDSPTRNELPARNVAATKCLHEKQSIERHRRSSRTCTAILAGARQGFPNRPLPNRYEQLNLRRALVGSRQYLRLSLLQPLKHRRASRIPVVSRQTLF